MNYKTVITFAFLSFFVASFIATPQAAALNENEENALLENFLELREDHAGLKENVRENYVTRQEHQTVVAELENRITTLENEIATLENLTQAQIDNLEQDLDQEVSDREAAVSELRNDMINRLRNKEREIRDEMRNLIDQRFSTLETELMASIENSQGRLESLTDEWEKQMLGIDNRIENLDEKYDNELNALTNTVGSNYRNLNERLEREEEENTGTIGLVIGLLALIGVGGLFLAIRTGKFAEEVPHWRNTDPKDQILAAFNLIDHRLEANAPVHLIDAAKAQRDRLVEQHPEMLIELVHDGRLGKEALNHVNDEEIEEWKRKHQNEEDEG